MYTNAKMTIFNRNSHSDVLYIPKLIENVFWDSKESISSGAGADKSDEVIVYIPTEKNDMSDYQPPKEYNKSFNGWTIQEGDFIVKGDVSEMNDEANIISGIKDLKDYEAFTIKFVEDNTYGSKSMQHFKIKGN